MRNNEERLGTKDDQSSPSTLSPLEFVSPTSFVKLPSRGSYYPEGHPLHNQETIEIKEMTAKEEDILTSKALLEQGVAIDRLLGSLLIILRLLSPARDRMNSERGHSISLLMP